MKTISEIKWGINVNSPKVDALDVRVFIDTAVIELQDDPRKFVEDEIIFFLRAFLTKEPKMERIAKRAQKRIRERSERTCQPLG